MTDALFRHGFKILDKLQKSVHVELANGWAFLRNCQEGLFVAP